MKTKTEKEQDISGAEVLTAGDSNSRLPEAQPEQMWTMEDAFEWDGYGSLKTDGLDLERGIRSVAFLLEYLSEAGNKEIAGFVAQGLGRCLSFCANKSAHLQKRHLRGDGL
jgi:hypothetical protein